MIDPSNYKIYYYDSLFQKRTEIDGVNNFSIEKGVSFNGDFMLGGIYGPNLINAPQQINLTFDRSYMQADPLLNYTGSESVSAFEFFDGNQFYKIANVYLISYSAGFSVGELPKINTRFVSYGGDIIQSETNACVTDVLQMNSDVPKLNSISICGLDDFKENGNIFSIEYNLNINRQPFYSVGSTTPTEVNSILPLEISASINTKASQKARFHELPQYFNQYKNNIEFDISICGESGNFNLPLRKGKLISTDINMSSQNTLEIKSNFRGYYGL
jgi:hypothetical protein